MAIALRHLLVLRITRFSIKILAFNRWIKCYSGPPASLILGVNLLFFLGERRLIEKKYGNRPKVELALCDVLITHEGKTGSEHLGTTRTTLKYINVKLSSLALCK